MPAQPRGSIYTTKTAGVGIRWPEDGVFRQRSGFRTKTEARDWFDDNVASVCAGPPLPGRHPRRVLRPSLTVTAPPSPPQPATLAKAGRPGRVRHLDATRARRRRRRRRRLAGHAPRKSRYRLTSALRQALGAAVRWRYIDQQPGGRRGPQPAAAGRGAAARSRRRRSTPSPPSSAPLRAARRLRRRNRPAGRTSGRRLNVATLIGPGGPSPCNVATPTASSRRSRRPCVPAGGSRSPQGPRRARPAPPRARHHAPFPRHQGEPSTCTTGAPATGIRR